MKIVFATNNSHKLEEIRQILGAGIEVLSLADIGCHDDIPETAPTLEGNAVMKARYVYDRYGTPCFADDTGLEVDALDGAPGVYSARYAGGKGHDSEANMSKLLHEMEGMQDRRARFRTVIALIELKDGLPVQHTFEGRIEGTISQERKGSSGFGYDPIFVPEGYEQSFAELGSDIKNSISHRARAVARLAEYLLSKER